MRERLTGLAFLTLSAQAVRHVKRRLVVLADDGALFAGQNGRCRAAMVADGRKARLLHGALAAGAPGARNSALASASLG